MRQPEWWFRLSDYLQKSEWCPDRLGLLRQSFIRMFFRIRSRLGALWAPLLVWFLAVIGIVIVAAWLAGSEKLDDKSKVFLGIVIALGIGGIVALPLRYSWSEASRRIERSRQLATVTQQRVVRYRDNFYSPFTNRVESFMSEASRLSNQDRWGWEAPAWQEGIGALFFRLAKLQSFYEPAREAGVEFIFATEDTSRRVRRRIQSLQRELLLLFNEDESLLSRLSTVVRSPAGTQATVSPLELTEHSPESFRELLTDGPKSLARWWYRSKHSSGDELPAKEIWRRFRNLTYLELQRLWALAEGAYYELALALEELDAEWYGAHERWRLTVAKRSYCVRGRTWWRADATDAAGMKTGECVVVISTVRGRDAEGEDSLVCTLRPSIAQGEANWSVKPFDRAGIATARIGGVRRPTEVEVTCQDGTKVLRVAERASSDTR